MKRSHIYIILIIVAALFIYGCSNTGQASKVAKAAQRNICKDTCASRDFNCGTQNICGTNVNCGACPSGQTCSKGECVSKKKVCTDSCAVHGFTCGTQNICNINVSCGSCQSGQTCNNGQCTTKQNACTCSAYGVNCGSKNICGTTVNCGTCSSGQTCTSGQCIIAPPPICTGTCASSGFTCGTQTICGKAVNCGTCSTGTYCTNSGQCIINQTNTSTSVCGNKIVEPGEVCDSYSQNCYTSNGLSGIQTCNSDCKGWSTCQPKMICGDNVKEPGEQCDGSDYGGLTCLSYGYTGGYLGCTSSCIVNTSKCSTVVDSCNDTDGGIVPSIYGYLKVTYAGSQNIFYYNDTCFTNYVLQEFYCNAATHASINYTCNAYGCSAGKCNRA